MTSLASVDTDPPSSRRDRRDAALLDRVRGGDSAAYAQLMHLLWRPLVLYASRIVDSLDAAEDIAQEAFVRLWERRASWRPASSPRLILYTISRNLAINQQKYGAARTRRLATRTAWLRRNPVTPVQALEGEEFRRALESAVESLPPRRREVLRLSRYDGLNRAEIAELMGLSPQTVANYLVIAMVELREALRPFLIERGGG